MRLDRRRAVNAQAGPVYQIGSATALADTADMIR